MAIVGVKGLMAVAVTCDSAMLWVISVSTVEEVDDGMKRWSLLFSRRQWSSQHHVTMATAAPGMLGYSRPRVCVGWDSRRSHVISQVTPRRGSVLACRLSHKTVHHKRKNSYIHDYDKFAAHWLILMFFAINDVVEFLFVCVVLLWLFDFLPYSVTVDVIGYDLLQRAPPPPSFPTSLFHPLKLFASFSRLLPLI